MELNARLSALIRYVPQGSVVADIGTDHAYVPVYLLLNKISPKVIASDVSEGPLQAAENTVGRYELQDKIVLRQGNGLEVLAPGEAGIIIVSGMGGNSIKKLLGDSFAVAEAASRLILQPMNNEGSLRLWLTGNGWQIEDEVLVRDGGKIYAVIVARRGDEWEQDDFIIEIGPRLIGNKDPLLKQYLQEIEGHYLKILGGLSKSRRHEVAKKAAVYARKLERIKGVKEWLQSCKPL